MGSDLDWLPQYTVGNEILDRQHRALLSSGKFLHSLLEQKSPLQDFESVVAEGLEIFLGMLIAHFADEEALMLESDYPSFLLHQKRHHDCIEFFTSAQQT